MKHPRWIFVLATLAAGVNAGAQSTGEIDLFGNDFPGPREERVIRNGIAMRMLAPNSDANKPAPEYQQTLLSKMAGKSTASWPG
jgi:hypothetical protein